MIIITKEYTLESALEAIRRGATDFLPKPLDRLRWKRALDDVASLYDQRRRVRALEEQLLRDLGFHGIVGKSPVMLEVFDFARKVARHYTNVLLMGPTGTGKELVARAIHELSPVSQQRLADCNCSAMVGTLLDSRLFGHVRGAFTGATEMRPGLFEYADAGTFFLDAVGETSLAMRAKLLRVIENREVQRVGSPEVRLGNVRLIAATNRDLRGEVLAGRFRENLFYRLSSIQIRVPSLTERREDIPLLMQSFVKKYNQAYGKSISGLTRRAQTVLLQHSWPGNVHGQPLAGRANVRQRTHQSVPLPETRAARACSAGKAAWGCRGRICADLILCVVDAEPGEAFDSSPNTGNHVAGSPNVKEQSAARR